MSTSRPPEATSITAVPASMAEDQGRRMRQYLLQMGLRVVLILVAALFARGNPWLLWTCIAGAVILPYTAVLFANAGRDRSAHEVAAVTPTAPAELPAAPTVRDADRHRVVDHVEVGPDEPPGDGPDATPHDDTDRKDA